MHNAYLAIICDAGILGFGFFVMLIWRLVVALRHVVRSGPPGNNAELPDLARLLGVLLALVLFMALFSPSHQFKFIWIVLGLCTVVGEILPRRQTPAP